MGEAVKVVAKNSKAYHDYFVEEKFEAGIELAGTEVKSIRLGNVNLKDSFCIIKEGQLSVLGMHISPYEKGNIFNKDPRRPRRLLMHRREILRLSGRIQQDGYSLIPLSVYFKGPRVKLELGLAKGKKLYDKRESSAKRDAKPVKQMTKLEKLQLIDKLEKQMKEAAKMLEFELAAALRDQIIELRGETQKK